MVLGFTTFGFSWRCIRKKKISGITGDDSDERKPEQYHCEPRNPQFPETPPAPRSAHDMHSAANGFRFSQTLLFFTARTVK